MSTEENVKINISEAGLDRVYSDLSDLHNLIKQINKTKVVVKVGIVGVGTTMKELDRLNKKLSMMSKKTYQYKIHGVHTTSGGGGAGGGGGPRIPTGGGGGRGGRGGGNRPSSASPGGGGRGRRGGLGSLPGLFAHSIPIDFYNMFNSIRFAGAAAAAGGAAFGPAGIALGAGLGAAMAAAIAGVHAHRIALSLATSAIKTAFSLAATSVASFSNHMFEVIEETRRAEVSFAALASMQTGKSLGQLRTEDPATFNAAMNISKVVSSRMRAISAETGQEFSRVAGAAKSLMADVLDKLSTPGSNALVDRGDEVIKITEGFIRLGAVMRMSDPMGRNLSQQIFPLQEILSGTSGKGAAELFTSLRRRTGIKISGQDATEIAGAVNAGNLSKALELLNKRMARAGVAVTMISDLFENTLTPNIDQIKAMFSGVFMPMFDSLYDSTLSQTKFIRAMFSKMSMGRDLPNSIQSQLKDFSNQIIETFYRSFTGGPGSNMDLFLKGFMDQSVLTNPMSNQNLMFTSIKSTILATIPALKAFANVVFQFFTGLLGLDRAEGASDFLKSLEKTLTAIAPGARMFGESLASTAENFVKIIPALFSMALVLQSIFSDILRFAGKIASFFGLGQDVGFAKENFRPQNDPMSRSELSGFGRSPRSLEEINKILAMQMAPKPVDPVLKATIQGLAANKKPAVPVSPRAPGQSFAPGFLAPKPIGATPVTVPALLRLPMTAPSAPPVRPSSQPVAVPQNKVEVKSSPTIKNDFQISVTPQLNDMTRQIFDAARRGSEEGTKSANAQNKEALNFALSSAMSSMTRSLLNNAAQNAAPKLGPPAP